MKELTIEEKAKRYDEAIKLVNTKWYYKNQPCFINVSELFPEFKENKDENIKKWLIEYFQEFKSTGIEGFANGLKIDNIVAWLEKQNNTDKVNQQIIDIPFGAKDSELQEATYYIPDGYHAEINGNEVIIKKDNQKTRITQYCYILNYNTGEAFKHHITEDEVNLTTEELLKKYGFKETECHIMYSSNNLELKLLEN